MKNKALLFFVIAFILLSIIPGINFIYGNKSFKIKNLYSVDFALPYINKKLYPYGISAFSDQVIIGKQDWLFLGDNYADTVSVTRAGVDSAYTEKAIEKNNTLYGWRRYFLENGVKDFKIMVGPNKSSIYPEFLPGWIEPADNRKIDILMDEASDDYYLYPRNALLAAKEKYSENELYYKTDTHWNNLGGWLAFDYFITELRKENPELNYSQSINLESISEINGGDLAGFLRLPGWLKDSQPKFKILTDISVSTQCRKYYTNEIYQCANNPEINAQIEPLLVLSDGAENTDKVLWLRDSFGTAVSPYMALLFSDIIQIHYGHVDRDMLVKLIKDFEPDYVFMTIVERDLDKGLPDSYPMLEPNTREKVSYSSRLVSYNDLKESNDAFSIQGNDPYLIYRLDFKVDGSADDSVALNLQCQPPNNDKDASVRLQVFWKEKLSDSFSEQQSERYSAAQGTTNLDLGVSHKWRSAKNIQYLRIDIEPESYELCTNFTVNNLIFNQSH